MTRTWTQTQKQMRVLGAQPKPGTREEQQLLELRPIVFKIVLEQQSITDVFALLNRFFVHFESNISGVEADKAEVMRVLGHLGLFNQSGRRDLEELACQTPGKISFREFVGFMAAQFLRNPGATVEEDEEDEFEIISESSGTAPVCEHMIKAMAPLAFRISSRTEDYNRLFGLFGSMFDAFAPDSTGCIPAKSLELLLTTGSVHQEDLEHLPNVGETLDFSQFLGFWIHLYLEEEEELHTLRRKLGPIVIKLALMQGQITELFELLQELFQGLDQKHVGFVTKSQLQDLQLVGSMGGAARLDKWHTDKAEGLQFAEFVAFYAQEFVVNDIEQEQPADQRRGKEGVTEMDEELVRKLGSIAFRLSARTNELRRMYLLFKAMFGYFDLDQDGLIDKNDISKLRDVMDFLDQEDMDELEKRQSRHNGKLNFNEFLSFWVSHYVKAETEEEVERAVTEQELRLAPVLFRLDCQKTSLQKVFALLKEVFSILDEADTGLIKKSDVAVLVDNGFLDGAGVHLLNPYKTRVDGSFSLSEFLNWIADSQTL